MKLITLFSVLLFSFHLSLGQQFGTIRYYAKYNILSPALQVSKDDAEYETEDAWLYFSGNNSLYQQKLNYTVTQVMRGPNGLEKKQIARPNPDKLDKIGAVYYKNMQTRELLYRENFTFSREKYYTVRDTMTNIKWNITNEKKNIGKFVCRKAEANAFGRKWTAWFTTDIPLSIGPWKLWGLPGAILEATDATNTYMFLFREVDIPNLEAQTKVKELKPSSDKFLSKNDLVKVYNQKKDEKRKYIMSILEEGGGSGAVEFKEEIEPYKQ
ncbi:MAG TPA: GLPGLI family protein [Chitinophagaceae bacterium]|nr:GLPGLI family protein [Chitinophagaceae bacterium]